MPLREPISPELVLVDPFLAAVERPREFVARVIARQVVPLGVPLAPREISRVRRLPAWVAVAIGLCLFTGGLLASFEAFRGPSSTGTSRPVTTVAPTFAGRVPLTPSDSMRLPTPP